MYTSHIRSGVDTPTGSKVAMGRRSTRSGTKGGVIWLFVEEVTVSMAELKRCTEGNVKEVTVRVRR